MICVLLQLHFTTISHLQSSQIMEENHIGKPVVSQEEVSPVDEWNGIYCTNYVCSHRNPEPVILLKQIHLRKEGYAST